MINACTYGVQNSIAADSVEMFLDQPRPGGHAVQLCKADERLLERNVSRYLLEGLKRRQGQMVIVTPARLAKFMSGGQPDWGRFENSVGAVLREVQAQANVTGLRAYGEIVGILWKAGKYSAAIRLEKLWNKLLESNSFSLFCAYPIDLFGSEFQMGGLEAILGAHNHLLPAVTNEDLENAIDQSLNEVLGRRAEGLRSLIKSNARLPGATLPGAEATILWLRNNLGDEAEEILARARLRYRASQSLRSHSTKNTVQ